MVKLKTDGEVDTAITASDIIIRLGLSDDGLGQFVGVNAPADLVTEGFAMIPDKGKLISLNPPEATVALEVTRPGFGGEQPFIKTITVNVDELKPLPSEKPLKKKSTAISPS